jgi:hypothetical protein
VSNYYQGLSRIVSGERAESIALSLKEQSVLPSMTIKLPVQETRAIEIDKHETETAKESDLASADIYTVKSKAKAKSKYEHEPKPWNDEDGPGEHAETRLLNKNITKVPLEEWFDDCGENTDPLDLPPDDSYLFYDGESTDDDSADGEYEELFNQAYYNHAMPGSNSDNFANPAFMEWEAALSYLMKAEGRDAVVELFGGLGKVCILAVRRGMPAGPNYEICAGFDLTCPKQVQQLYAYLKQKRPLVLIAGPPCTSMGGWSRLNRVLNYAQWRATRDIGEQLSRVTANAAHRQHQAGDHFLVENPLGSDLWSLPEWIAIAQLPGVVTAKLHL